ncbi:hypothetical protein BRE01_18890 [Brevibacillus reuszeri]|uniref:Beta-lactamase-related domain-containing protein n=2 Tax=Brevibacillus reuszeri TaxID=54915 RepID=A0ABQ0TLE9_9BACL|nr:serine hydrolase domain-containing protein [Brevibacillus reuszeri]MED1857057.1 serine hydrolase [Brevibacillus reuszeri]GED68187.1 hypothetical protein BRE01_18890 [Brevibacillus reuszeri]
MKITLIDVMTEERIHRFVSPPTHQLTIGLVTKTQRHIWTREQLTEDVQSDSLYEIGSITKTMTGLLLAIGEQRGLWHHSDRLADLVPEWSSSSFAQQTTLLQLVTHTAGLPPIPDNLRETITDKRNPYAKYTESHLIDAVMAERPTTRTSHRYSNFGFGILGWLLSRKIEKSLHDALYEEIFQPLGMTSSGIGSKVHHPDEILPVYTSKGKSTPHWDFHDTFAAAGGVLSSLSDMLTYIEAYLTLDDHPLCPALDESSKEHYSIFPGKGIGIGYGWMFYREKDGSTTHWHNGGTYGSSSFAAFNRDKGIGLVVFSNHGLDAWSQLPLIGMRRMNVDKLARILTTRLFEKA